MPEDVTIRGATVADVPVIVRHRRAMFADMGEDGFKSIVLHASPDGPHLYESLGSKPTNEMRLRL